MCFFYAIKKEKTSNLIQHKITTEKQLSLFENTFFTNGFERPLLPVITCEKPEEIQLFNWGLIPSWVKDQQQANDISLKTLNAKAETIFERSSFKNNILKHRCLVLCSGFFENFHKNKKERYSFFISLKDDSVFCLAGIYDYWTNPQTGEVNKTYSIVTQQANELMAGIHNTQKRQPVILEYEDALQYISQNLSQHEIEQILSKRIDFKKLKATPINTINPRTTKQNNRPDISAYYHFPEMVEYFRHNENFTEEMIECLKK